MLTFAQKSNWIVNNQSRIAKAEKAIKSLEETIAKTKAHKACVEYNFHRELGLFSGTPAEYNQFFSKHENDIADIDNTIESDERKVRRMKSVAQKLCAHEKVIFALPHTW
jgi:hypothetical protein